MPAACPAILKQNFKRLQDESKRFESLPIRTKNAAGDLGAGDTFTGPAIVEEFGSTVPVRLPICGSFVEVTTGGCGWLMFAAGVVSVSP